MDELTLRDCVVVPLSPPVRDAYVDYENGGGNGDALAIAFLKDSRMGHPGLDAWVFVTNQGWQPLDRVSNLDGRFYEDGLDPMRALTQREGK